jgi:hypothetical protein
MQSTSESAKSPPNARHEPRAISRARLMPGVDMTSNVQGCSQRVLSSSPVPLSSRCPAAEAAPGRHAG